MTGGLALRPEPASVKDARRFVGERLPELGFDGATFVAELLVSELVTNAVLHAHTDIHVDIDVRGELVRIGVSDDSPGRLLRRRHSVESGTGRGLLLVDRMAERWGVDLGDDGKVVWFELPSHPVVPLDDEEDEMLESWRA